MKRSAEVLLVIAAASALLFVPDWPHRHLLDPNYWGVAGFLLVVLLLLRGSARGWEPGSPNRRMVVLLLVGLPLIYVADWLRFGGSNVEFGLQVFGLGAWVALAFRARASDVALWLGCAAHALWDAAHFGRVNFVPEWYIAACIAADLGIGAFVLLCLRSGADAEAA